MSRRAYIAAAAILVMAAACGSSERTNGPVEFGSMRGTMCLPTKTAIDFLAGGNVVANTATTGVDVTSVTLDGATDITFVGAYFAPITGNDLFPNDTVWPVDLRTFDPLVKPDWAHREDALGPARLSGATKFGWNFVLHLKATGPSADVKDVVIHYTSGGQAYKTTNGIALQVRPHC